MTKEELREIVDRMHASWNIQPLPAQLQTIYRAWWDILSDCDKTVTDSVLTNLIKEDSWAPRPGTIYRRVMERTRPDMPPSSHEAWEHYRTLAAQLDTGVWQEQQMHPTLQKTIATIGGYHLHTNADREHFTQIYTKYANEEYQ
jgi:hypothetical protein